MLVFDFKEEASLSNWYILDDGVMGGRSAGEFSLTEQGHGCFHGKVSLENNGGFSSVRYRPDQTLSIDGYSKIVIRLKADGKNYQFRTKSNYREAYSYISVIQTSGSWETIEIDLKEMYPSFRGRRLDMPNYPATELAEIAFLIGNKKAEDFRVEIDWIKLQP